jgi:dihydroflavonol-4-reductase
VRALRGVDALVHCAAVYAYGSDRADEVAQVNVAGTRAVLEAAAAAGVGRAVVTSSSVTCGSSAVPVSRTEDDQLHGAGPALSTGGRGADSGHPTWGSDGEREPAPAYYASKVAQEDVALETGERHGLRVVLALPTVVLGGPFARLGPSNAIVLRYLLDPTRSTYPGGCNVVDARDVAAGHLVLLEHGTPGGRYLLGGEDVTWRTFHTLVAHLAGLPGPFAEVPASTAWLASAASEAWARLTGATPLSTREEAETVGRYYWYSSAKASELGYAARPARAAVAASLAWLAISPDLPRWVREGLRLHPDVRAARPLVPAPLPGAGPDAGPSADSVSPRPRPSRPARPRRPH